MGLQGAESYIGHLYCGLWDVANLIFPTPPTFSPISFDSVTDQSGKRFNLHPIQSEMSPSYLSHEVAMLHILCHHDGAAAFMKQQKRVQPDVIQCNIPERNSDWFHRITAAFFGLFFVL